MKRLLLILSVLLAGAFALPAQTISDEITQMFSPNAAELGKYGKIPVNYFNGLPNIQVPLTTLKAKGADLPIYLTYHAGGHKPEQHPGWVGLGWTLRAGGCINRIINNRQDEVSHDEIWQERTKPLTYQNSDLDTLSYFDYLEKGAGWAENENAAKAHFRHNLKYGIWCDMEPDEFQINLDGIQASFYITGYDSRTGQCTVRIKSRQPYDFSVKVFLSNTGGNHINDQIHALLFQYISKIIVTDSDGVRYIFGGDGNDLSSIEFSIKPCSTYRYGMASASTWNLTRIEYPNNETITFRYRKDGRPIVRTILREGRGLNYKIDGDNYGNYLLDSSLPPSSTGSWYNYYINNDLYSQRDDSPYIKLMYLSPSYLSSVRSKASGDSVVFHISRSIELKDLGTDTDPTYEDAAELFRTKPGFRDNDAYIDIENILSYNYYMCLDSISQGQKRILFTYGNNADERLSLSSVSTVAGTDDGGKYSFEYNSLKLPDHYCSESSDRWGFNGKSFSVPPGSYQTLHDRRAPDTTLTKAEILQKITYPTGGSTEYIFEPHTYCASVQRTDSPQIGFSVVDNANDSIAGGLRIKTIIDRNGDKTETRNFFYTKNGRSSGILSGTPVFFIKRDYNGKVAIGGNGRGWIGPLFWKDKGTESTLELSYWIGSESYLNQLSTTDGNHVTYSNVTEVFSDGGRIEYEYSNHREALDASFEGDISCYSPENPDYILRRLYASHSLDRGLLLSKGSFDHYGRVVEEEHYEYNNSPNRFTENVSVCQIGAESFPNLINGRGDGLSLSKNFTYCWTAGSRIYTYFPYLKSKEVKTFHYGSGTSSQTAIVLVNYGYDNHRRLVRTTTTESAGGELTDSVRYTGSDGIRDSGVYAEMTDVSVNMSGIPIERIRYKNGKVIGAELTTYRKIAKAGIENYVPEAEYAAKLDEPASSFDTYDGRNVESQYGDPIIEYVEYDGMCNPLEVVKNGTGRTSILWGYEGMHPVALFNNATRRAGTIMVEEPGLVSDNEDHRTNTEHWFSYSFETLEGGDCEVHFDIPENVPDFDFWVVLDSSTYYRPRTREWVDDGSGGGHDSEVYVEFTKTVWLAAGKHRLAVTTLDPTIYPIPEEDAELESEANLEYNYLVRPQTSIEIPEDAHSAAGWLSIAYRGKQEREVNGFIGDYYHENFEGWRGNRQNGFHSEKGYVGEYTVNLEVSPERVYYVDYRVLIGGQWKYKKYRYYGPCQTINEGSSPIDEIRVYPVDGSVITATWSPNVGPRGVSDTRGMTTSYEYDGLGRLILCMDNDQSPTTGYAYHFRNDSDSTNHIRKTVYTEKNAAAPRVSTDYFDGLGRSIQTIMKGVGTNGGDISNLFEYDRNGRLLRSWLNSPVYNNGDGCVNPDVFKENASSFYGNTTSAESRPFSENVYDGSPLDRVKAVYGVGQDWFSAGKCAETEFLTNSTDVSTLKCLNLKVEEYSDTSFTVKKAGFYPASSLLVTKSMDEDGNTAYSFTDFSGKTLLERRVLSSDETADTYYVYDDFDDLRAVIPPMLSKEVSTSTSTHWTSDSEPFGRWAFLYVYDSRHRCVAKKMPGAGWNLTLYDKAGNAILTQDARQREQNEWAFNIPDALGRVCLQGLCEESSLFGNDTGIDVFSGPFQNVAVRAFRSQGSLAATSAFYGYSIDGMVIDSTTTFLTVNYYDDHSFVGMYGFPQDLLFDEAPVDNGYGNRWSSAHNLLTGSMSAVITSEGVSTGKFRHTALFYDEYGRVVQTISRYEDGGRIRTASAFDFAGNQTLSREVVSMSDACDTVERIDTYDLWGRIKRTTTSLSDGSGLNASSTVGYTYDNVGRLVGVTYGTGANAVNESLAYNVRGWLTEKRSSVFGMRLRYNTPVLGSVPCWNGGVSEWEWWFGTGTPQAYSFSYDALGRLTDSRRFIGASGSPTDSFSERDLSYDLNGNILTLNRFGESSLLPEDALTFSYSGNRINSVSGSPSFGYDSNGNMTADGRLGLNLSYNHLNLVSEVSDASGSMAHYTYISDGTKISAEKPDDSGTVYRGSLVYSKDGNGNLSLDCVLTDGGSIAAGRNASGNITAYHPLYHLADHLGSVRAVVDGDTGSVIETNDYYPFGKRIPVTGPVASTISATGLNRWLFSGKEDQSFLSAGIPLLDFGARMYNPAIARWTAIDPLADEYYNVSPYAYCLGNPIRNIDILGLRPIYSTEGYLLGTDDGGIQGEQIIMKKDNFVQGMRTEDALKYNLGVEGLDGEEAVTRFNDSFNQLKDRPDWDGYITLEEANEWYRSGNGEPLFADINKIDFSSYVSWGEKYVGKTYVINLLNGKSKINDGLVYGKIVVKRYPNHGIRAYSDRYDFDIKRPYLLHTSRNILTHIGAKVAGQGTAFNINIYGEKKLKPILPWIK